MSRLQVSVMICITKSLSNFLKFKAMRYAKYLIILFLFSNLFISCTGESINEDDLINQPENAIATDDDSNPPDNPPPINNG